jgi:hypothetical protein
MPLRARPAGRRLVGARLLSAAARAPRARLHAKDLRLQHSMSCTAGRRLIPSGTRREDREEHGENAANGPPHSCPLAPHAMNAMLHKLQLQAQLWRVSPGRVNLAPLGGGVPCTCDGP